MLKWCNFMSIILMLTKLQGQYLEQWKKKKNKGIFTQVTTDLYHAVLGYGTPAVSPT